MQHMPRPRTRFVGFDLAQDGRIGLNPVKEMSEIKEPHKDQRDNYVDIHRMGFK